MPKATFAERVLEWFSHSGRHHLPWQEQPDAYRVWISEIMLQQTQVNTVIPYFQTFMAQYPNIAALAKAPQDEVLHLWTGLGYYARARNLHRCAQIVQDEHRGQFPNTVEGLVALPGIGRSTAGAILALGMGIRAPILDGNVKRVLCRYHAIEGWPDQPAVQKLLWPIAEATTPKLEFAAYTQAMMDLGATLCTRSKPACQRCPLQGDCKALTSNRVAELPHRKPKKTLPRRSTYMLMCCNAKGEVLLEQRPAAGIWGGLWSFKEFETLEDLDAHFAAAFEQHTPEKEVWPVVKHTFSHFHLDITPVFVSGKPSPLAVMEPKAQLCYPLHSLHSDSEHAVGLAAPVKALLVQLQHRLNHTPAGPK
jgi:A/G-specific adenine glycosylase